MRVLGWSLCCVVAALIAGLLVALHSPGTLPLHPDTTNGHAVAALAPPARPPAPRGSRRVAPPTEAPANGSAVAPRGDSAPSRPVSRADARDRLRERLRRSGRSAEPWTARVDRVFADWRTATPQLAGSVTIGPVECYREGCIAEIVATDRAAFDEINESLPATTAFLEFPGWRHRTGVVTRADGSVTATWFFMRPDGPVAKRE